MLILCLYSCLGLRYSDKKLVKKLKKNELGYIAHIERYDTLGREIRYVEIGDENKPLLMFLHGAPGSSSFWVDYLKDSLLLSQFKLLAPDRPGYGYSEFGRAENSVAKEAAIISKILHNKRKLHDIIILYGFSYGGTLVARLAMDYPELVDGIILQSASMAPKEEKIYSISYPISKRPLKWLVPTSLDMANEEKLNHRQELDEMLPFWENIVAPAIIMHGTADKLIYPRNASFAKEQLTNSPFVDLIWVKGRGHDLAWTRYELTLENIQRLVDIVKEEKEGL